MVEEEKDKKELSYSCKMIVIYIDFQEPSVYVTQDKWTRSRTIISTYLSNRG